MKKNDYIQLIKEEENFIPNGGQIYLPWENNTKIPRAPWTPCPRPNPPFQPLELLPKLKQDGWDIFAKLAARATRGYA